MNCCSVLLLAGLLLSAHFAEAVPKTRAVTVSGIPVTVQGNHVELDAGGNSRPNDSISPMLAAVKAYPQAKQFRLTWELHMMVEVDDVQFVYDRSRHTLTVYSRYCGDETVGNVAVQFAPVSESVLSAILKAHPHGFNAGEDSALRKIAVAHKNNADLWGGFEFLYRRRYGCHAMVLRHSADSIVWPETNWPQ